MPSAEELAEIIEATHPDYDLYIDEWARFRNAYDGDPNVITKYLKQHSREDNKVFQERQDRAYYLNFVAAVLDLYIAYLAKVPPTTELPEDMIDDPDLLAFRENADRAGRRLEGLFLDAKLWAMAYGFCGLLVDTPRPDAPPLNEAERVEMGLRPYAVIYTPPNIINWSLDGSGRLNWVRLREAAPETTGPFERRVDPGVYYRTWTRESWALHRVTKEVVGNKETSIAELVVEGGHDLERVPLAIMYSRKGPPSTLVGKSPIRDIVQINFAMYNWCSLLDEEIYNKCLNILLVPMGGAGNLASDVVIGSRNVLEYDTEQPPSYLAPATEPTENLLHLLQVAKDWIYRLAKLGGIYKMQETGQVASGIAIKQEFLETNQALRHEADEMEAAARDVWDIACRWVGRKEGFEGGTVNFPDEFGVHDFYEDLNAMMLLRNEIPSPTARREAAKEFVSAYFPHLDQSIREVMFTEIDKADLTEPIRVDIDPGLDSNLARNKQQGQARGKLRDIEGETEKPAD